jgi:hypothetical protein
VNHRLYRHPQRCIELRNAAAISTSTIHSISSITATVPHSYRSAQLPQPPLSTATAKFLPLFYAAAVFYRHYFLLPPFSTAAISTAVASYRRRFLSTALLSMPLPIDAASY